MTSQFARCAHEQAHGTRTMPFGGQMETVTQETGASHSSLTLNVTPPRALLSRALRARRARDRRTMTSKHDSSTVTSNHDLSDTNDDEDLHKAVQSSSTSAKYMSPRIPTHTLSHQQPHLRSRPLPASLPDARGAHCSGDTEESARTRERERVPDSNSLRMLISPNQLPSHPQREL